MGDVADEATKGREPARSFAIQHDDASRFADFISYDPDGLVQVRILRQHYRHIEKVAPGVMDEICREVHIGALFFCRAALEDRKQDRLFSSMFRRLNAKQ